MALDDSYSKSLLHFNNALTDESGKVWTANGGIAANGSAKYGTYGLACGGGKFLSTPITSTTDVNISGTTLFTVDGWINTPDVSSYEWQAGIWGTSNANDATGFTLCLNYNKPTLYVPGVGGVAWGLPIPTNTWVHVAFVRKDTSATGCGVAVNGIFQWFNGNFALKASTLTKAYIGHFWSMLSADLTDGTWGAYDARGYRDEIRFSVGVARWIEDFQPPLREYSVGDAKAGSFYLKTRRTQCCLGGM